MAVTIITAATAFRAVVGLVGVGYSLYSTQTPDGKFDFDKVPQAIFGNAVGNLFSDWFREGTTAAYDRLVAVVETASHEPHIGMLQRAARKAQLTATLLACETCIAEYESNATNVLQRIQGRVLPSPELEWLRAVAKDLGKKLADEPSETISAPSVTEIIETFRPDNVDGENAVRAWKEKAQSAIISELKNTYYSKLLGQKAIPFNEDASQKLEQAIRGGWANRPIPNGRLTELGLGSAPQKVNDWFELVCILFNSDYKTNQTLQLALIGGDLAQVRGSLLTSSLVALDSLGRIEAGLEVLSSEVSRHALESLRKQEQIIALLKSNVIESGLGDEIGFAIGLKTVLEPFLPPSLERMVIRKRLVEEVSEKLSENPAVVLTGSSGMGKSILSYCLANSSGGEWRRIDMRGLESKDIERRLAFARNLLISSTSSSYSCLIDDLNFGADADGFKTALVDFLTEAKRLSRKVVLTSQTPPPAMVRTNVGITEDALVPVPALSLDEVRELLVINECPTEHIDAFGKLVWSQTMGHPLLAHARIIELGGTGWKASDAKALFSPNSLEDVRAEIRNELSTHLASEERQLLYRLDVFNDRFTREGAVNLANHPPSITLAGELFDRLVGPWIEPIDRQYFRLSPLLHGNASKLFTSEEVRELHRAAATFIINLKEITHIEFGGLLMHGLLGSHAPAFGTGMMGWFKLPVEHRKGVAEYVEWFKFVALDKPILADDPFGNHFARSLQFEIASQLGGDAAKKVVARWEEEVTALIDDERISDAPEFLTATIEARFLQVVLFDDIQFPFDKLIKWTGRFLEVLPWLASTSREIPEEFAKEDDELPHALAAFDDPTFAVGVLVLRFRDGHSALGLLEALDDSQTLYAENIWKILRGENDHSVITLVDRIWLAPLEDANPNWDLALSQLERAAEVGARQNVPALVASAYASRSVIQQEYLGDTPAAIAELEACSRLLGYEHNEIANYRAKIHSFNGEDVEAVKIWTGLLPDLSFTRTYFCRDAEKAAARLEQWDAVAEFALAGAKLSRSSPWDGFARRRQHIDSTELSFHADASFALWKAGKRDESLAEIAGILEELQSKRTIKELSDSEHLLYHRLRYLLVWMLRMDESLQEPAPASFTHHEVLPQIEEVEPLEYGFYWYLLSQIEHRFELGHHYLDRLGEQAQGSNVSSVIQFAYLDLAIKRAVVDGKFEGLVGEGIKIGKVAGLENANRAEEVKRILTTALISEACEETLDNIPISHWMQEARAAGDISVLAWVEELASMLANNTQAWLATVMNQSASSDVRLIASILLSFAPALNPRERFYANGVFLSARSSLGQWIKAVDNQVGERITECWRRICYYQRFALYNPAVTVERILGACESDLTGFPKAASVLLAAAGSTDITLTPPVREDLEALVISEETERRETR